MKRMPLSRQRKIALFALRTVHLSVSALMGVALVLTFTGPPLRESLWGQALWAFMIVTALSNILNHNRCPLTDTEHYLLGTYEDHAKDQRFMAHLTNRLGLRVHPVVFDAFFYLICGVVIGGYFL